MSELIPARAVSLDELMSTSDIVSLSLPLNEKSHKIIGKDHLALMKRSGILVNVGRSEVVDEAALIECLRERRIAGAGLDVYMQEPLSLASELLGFEQVMCTPHMAGVGWENVERRIAMVWRNLEVVLQGGVPSGVVTTTKRRVNVPVA